MRCLHPSKKNKKISPFHCGFAPPASFITYKAATTGKPNPGKKRIVGADLLSILQKIRVLLAAVALTLCVTPGWASTESKPPTHTQRYNIDIPALNAAEALNELAAQTGATFLFPYEQAKSRQANGVTGQFTLMNALERLLAGSGLSSGLSEQGVLQIFVQESEDNDNDNERREAMKSRKSILAAVIGFLVGSGGATNATAQDGIETAPKSKVVLEEVIVTAEKRAESLQDIPVAITAFAGDRLVKSGIDGIESLRSIVPSFQFGRSAADNIISIRGVGAELANIGSEPGVTVNQDGVPLSSQYFFDADFLDIERVEVLRGPQGTINGRNSTGGALNFYSKMPADEFEAGIKLTLGNYNRYATQGYVSGPLMGDNLRGRLAFKTDRSEGWMRNTFLNKDVGDKNKYHLRGILSVDLTEKLDANLIVEALNDKSTGQGLFITGRVRPDVLSIGEFAGVTEINPDTLDFEADQENAWEKKQYNVALNVNWELGPKANLKSTTSYIDYGMDVSQDNDGTRLSITQFPFINYQIWQFSEELTLTADLTDNLDMIFGGIYLRQNAVEPIHFVSETYIDLAPGLFIDKPENNLSSYAGYGQLRYKLTDKLRLSAGVRYTYDEKDTKEVLTGRDEEDTFGAWTPRLALDYALTDDVTLFANAARGFKSGGFNTFQNTFGSYKPEVVWSYEGGIKSRMFDDRLSLSASAFYMDYKDIQQNIFGLGGSFTPTVLNAGQAEIKGLELELDALVTEHLRFGFSGAYLDSEIKELRTADPLFQELGVPDSLAGVNIRDLAGNVLPRSPKLKMTVSGEYTRPIFDSLQGAVRLEYSWQDKIYFSAFNHEGLSQNSYGLLNLHASLESADGYWSMSVFAHNVLDERYFNNGLVATGVAPIPVREMSFGEPRMYGVSLSFNF